jgi:hypothetical protein
MASTNIARTAGQDGPRHPMMGTHPSAANQFFALRTIVQLDASGNAVSPGTADVSGLHAVGLSDHTLDNRTGSEAGGLAGDANVETAYGVKCLAYTGTAPKAKQVVYVVDNQTVSVDSLNGTRGIAGICVEQRDGFAYVLMGPDVVASVIAAAYTFLPIPLNSFVDADGDPLAKFASAASPTFGLNLADSEALNIRWNNDASPGTALCQISLPPDLDDAADMDLEFLVSKSGATLADATTLTITAFLRGAGDLHDGDANAGGVTGAVVGDAAAKTLSVLRRTIAAADVPAGGRTMTFTVTPTAGTLGTDDLLLHECRLRYKRRM